MCRRFLLLLVIGVALAVQAVLGAYAAAATPAWTTYRHDPARSGIDPDSTGPVTPSQAWQTSAFDGEVYGQPLVYGSHVYVATENDTVYELDTATGAVVWQNHVATPEPSAVAPCGDITPSVGVTSTPVIDPAANRIYVVGAVSSSGAVHHELFALDLSSGQVVAGFPIMVDPPFPSGGAAVNQLQRAGLALDNGRILIGYGGNDGDCNTYWGWLVSAAVDGTGITSFQADAAHTAGAIWAAGNAPAIDAAGNVFVATGNGIGNTSSDPDYGDSVVKLNASASALDWWAPPNWQTLDFIDADLGSSMPTLLPGGYLFQSGKDGNGYLLNGAALGHVSSPAAQVSAFCPGGSFGGSVYDPTNSTIYAACTSGLRALSLGSGSPPSLALDAGFAAPSGATGPPTISGGLVWVANSFAGALYGLDPTSGTTRSQFPIPENGSNVNHFASPSAGGGRLFLASGNQVTAYTLAPTTSAAVTTKLTAAAQLVLFPPPPGVGLGTLSATLTSGGSPLAGRTIVFSIAWLPLCAAVTNTSGVATCGISFLPELIVLLAGGYSATFSGDASYLSSSATTPWIALGSGLSGAARVGAHRHILIIGGTLTRGRLRYAVLTTQRRHGVAALKLRQLRRIRPGRYTLTLKLSGGTRVRRRITLG